MQFHNATAFVTFIDMVGI